MLQHAWFLITSKLELTKKLFAISSSTSCGLLVVLKFLSSWRSCRSDHPKVKIRNIRDDEHVSEDHLDLAIKMQLSL